MVEEIEIPAQVIAGVRAWVTIAELGGTFGPSMERAAAGAGALIAGPASCVYHADEGDRFDATIGFPVSARPSASNLEIVEVPAGRALRYTHVGDYPGLSAAYGALEAALAERGLTRKLAIEQYLVGPADDPDPAHWRTEVTVPLP
jgi:effector-binding domain-containing protein